MHIEGELDLNILNELGKKMLFFDGGLGTMLQARGLKPGASPEAMSIESPDILVEIHREYLDAGADIIYTNTFGANTLKYSKDELEKIIKAVFIL